MTVHILKMAVGVESVEHLRHIQSERLSSLKMLGDPPVLRHWTRNKPKRINEIIDGGSLYWIIKGSIRVRQRILKIESRSDIETNKKCGFVLDASVVLTIPRPARPIQGWRYLEEGSAPRDVVESSGSFDEMPEDMAKELRELGLL